MINLYAEMLNMFPQNKNKAFLSDYNQGYSEHEAE